MTGGATLPRRAVLGRGVLGAAAGLAAGGAWAGTAWAQARPLAAADFGAAGDGKADDTAALQKALDAAFAGPEPGMLNIRPGVYRVTRTLRINPGPGGSGNVTRHCGIIAHGARFQSAIQDGSNVIELVGRGTVRFVLLEGLDIQGNGREGTGLHLECETRGKYFYNFCLRDIVAQNCGGDGCRLVGNVFEGQVINSYFRGNRGNGVTFSHGRDNTILSAIHVFGCVFGQNGKNGAAMIERCYDVSFHGCYFLLNKEFGLNAGNGCTLLSNCGFENNHEGAPDFARGDAGIKLLNFGTLIGCTSYSIYKQTHLIRAFVAQRLTMIGCVGLGGGNAKAASLAKISGSNRGNAVVVGCSGAVAAAEDFDVLEIGGPSGGVRFGADWRSRNLAQLGEYRLWVDRQGKLRMKRGQPSSDDDGSPIGTG